MATVTDVARYILDRLETNRFKRITTWKLQKLVYYSQAWSLVWDDEPLFDARIEAWANGPVCPDLYRLHRGQLKVYADEIEGDPSRLTRDQRETVDAVLKHYGGYSAQYLSELTHAERPWLEARADLRPGDRGQNEISLDVMAEYYGGL